MPIYQISNISNFEIFTILWTYQNQDPDFGLFEVSDFRSENRTCVGFSDSSMSVALVYTNSY